jgi:hypothetical protein
VVTTTRVMVLTGITIVSMVVTITVTMVVMGVTTTGVVSVTRPSSR